MKRLFYLLPSGRFISFIGNSYFCGYYRGDDRPSCPVEVELEFPFELLFVDYIDGRMRINFQILPYRKLTRFSTPELPNVGCQSSKFLGELQVLEYLVIERGTLRANGGIEKILQDFPLERFELRPVDITRANQFLAWGFRRVEFIYALYRSVFFISCETDWMAFYLRVGHRVERDNA